MTKSFCVRLLDLLGVLIFRTEEEEGEGGRLRSRSAALGAQAGAVPALFRALAPVHADPVALASEGKCGKRKSSALQCSAPEELVPAHLRSPYSFLHLAEEFRAALGVTSAHEQALGAPRAVAEDLETSLDVQLTPTALLCCLPARWFNIPD